MSIPEPSLLSGIPNHLQARWQGDELERVGVLLRDKVTKRIVGHYQPSAEATRRAVEAASQGASSASGMGLSAQSLQMLGAVGSVASVLNLGVTVGGFALVLSRLKKLDGKVDDILDRLSDVQERLDRPYKIKVLEAARRSEEAFSATTPAEQERKWREAESAFSEAAEHFAHDIVEKLLIREEKGPVPLYGRLSLQEALDLLDWLTVCARGRIEALYLLRQPGVAAQFAATLSGWLGRFEIDHDAYVEHRLDGRVVSTSLRKALRAEGEAARDLLEGWKDYAAHAQQAAMALHRAGIDTNRFVRETREHPEPELLFLPLDLPAEEVPEIEKSVGRSRARA